MNNGTEINVKLKAQEDDLVNVKNYRAGDKWEAGKVMNVDVSIYKRMPGDTRPIYHVTYRVKLNRTSTKGNPVFLHVGDDGIDNLMAPVRRTKITIGEKKENTGRENLEQGLEENGTRDSFS